MSDRLFNVWNAFFLGNYQTCVNEGLDASDEHDLTEAEIIERDFYVHRSYVCMGQHALVTTQITDDAATALQGVKLLARYTSGDDKVRRYTLGFFFYLKKRTYTRGTQR